MNLQTGSFNLFPIFEFAANNSTLPSHKNTLLQKDYSKVISQCVSEVPKKPGWYLWGRFNDMGWWETVYLGHAGVAQTLHTRLYDELREECIAFWSEVYGRERAIRQNKNIYRGKYGDATRSLRKSGSRIVAWVAADNRISEKQIKRQEDYLIKIYRPSHNAVRLNLSEHDKLTTEIESTIEHELKKLTRKRSNQQSPTKKIRH